MTDLLLGLSELRDAAEDLQTFSRLAADERDPEKRREWNAKARHALGVVKAQTKVAERIVGWV